MGEEGLPQGVETDSEATWVKPGSSRRPVPPMTAIATGPVRFAIVSFGKVGW
jgi:hypothetical protein